MSVCASRLGLVAALAGLNLSHKPAPCPQLLGELLLDRANGKVMMKYVSEPTNLMLMMILLKDNSRSIQFEAFHVFKVRGHALPRLCS